MTALESALASWLTLLAGLGHDTGTVLAPPATPSSIGRAAAGIALPADLEALYGLANGQTRGRAGPDRHDGPFFGSGYFLSLEEALAERARWHALPSTSDEDRLPYARRRGPRIDLPREWFPLSREGGGANGLAYVLETRHGVERGRIVTYGTDLPWDEWEIVADSLVELLDPRNIVELRPLDLCRETDGARTTLSFGRFHIGHGRWLRSLSGEERTARLDIAEAVRRRYLEFVDWLVARGHERESAGYRAASLLEPFGAFYDPYVRQGASRTGYLDAELARFVTADPAHVPGRLPLIADGGEHMIALMFRWWHETGQWDVDPDEIEWDELEDG